MTKVGFLNAFSIIVSLFFVACGQHGSMDSNMMQMSNNTQAMSSLEEQHHTDVMKMQDPAEIISATSDYANTMTANVDQMMEMNGDMMSSHGAMDQQDTLQIGAACATMKEALADHWSAIQDMSQVDEMLDECNTHYQAMQGLLNDLQSMMQSYGTMMMK